MSPLRPLALALCLPLALACHTAFASSAGAPPTAPSAGLFPEAREALALRAGDAETDNLAHLVDLLGQASGVSFTCTEHVRSALTATPTGLFSDVEVPASEAWVWVEGILAHQGYALGAISTRQPHLAGIYGRPNIDHAPRAYMGIEPGQLPALREHPALLVKTTVDLEHVDARQLSNSMRVLVQDPGQFLNVVPAGTASSILVQGRARDVEQFVDSLRAVDAAEERVTEEQQQEADSGR